jgi:hypothetical protein
MTRQTDDAHGGWYEAIVRRQYYDELLPSFEAQQNQMTSYDSAFLICAHCVGGLFGHLVALARSVRSSLRPLARWRAMPPSLLAHRDVPSLGRQDRQP